MVPSKLGLRVRSPWSKDLEAFLVFVTLLVLAWPPSASARNSVEIRLARGDWVVIAVHLNGDGPYDFLFDTGASSTVVDRSLAPRLGLIPLGEVSFATVTGNCTGERARLDRLKLGDEVVEDLLVVCSDLRELRTIDNGIQGVLGFDVLSRVNLLLDYKEESVTFGEAREFAELRGTTIPFDPSERRILLELGNGSKERDTLTLALDSGANCTLLYERSGRAFSLDIRRNLREPCRVSTSHGFRVATTGRIRQLDVGNLRLTDVPVMLVPRDASEEALPEDGLLPTKLFRSVYVDHERSVVVLNPEF